MHVIARLRNFLSASARKLFEIKDTPHAIAGGAAIGIFMGFPPLFGLKTLICLGLATVCRVNRIAAVIAVCLTDVLTPVLPVLLAAQYEAGYFILSHPHHLPEKLDAASISLSDMLKWTTFLDAGLPLLVGSLVFAIPSALITYPLVLALAKKRANH
jgi:uncharacterized protein